MSADLTLAHQLADIADAITAKRFRARDLRVESKSDSTPVTDADRSTEQALRVPDDAPAQPPSGATSPSSRDTALSAGVSCAVP